MLSVTADALAHVESSIPFGQRLASIGRQGEDVKLWEQRATQNWPRLSPDGRRLAWQLLDAVPGSPDLWVEDLDRGTRHRVTRDGAAGVLPVWSPDGNKLAYVTGTLPKPVLVTASADGTGPTSTVPCPRGRCDPTDWSADGRWLLTTVRDQGVTDVWMLAVGAGEVSRPLLAESYPERDARFSPDGRLVAYVSEETRAPEVMIQALDEPRRREVISVGGGNQPVWSRDGSELFFVDLEGALRSARMRRAADGRPLFDRSLPVNVPRIGTGHFATQYDVSPDGRRIYFLDRRLDPAPAEFGVVLGWQGLLK
jgi:Tol biopolymer transport system component